jgi:hypothetical protein
MQVVCGNCQLTFDTPEGTTGLVCPICRSPLQADGAASGASGSGPVTSKIIQWNGGTLTDLIGLLSAPAASARVEVLPAGQDAAIGEVHLLAGGVSDAIYKGQATDDALDRLLTVTPARFRVEQRLPHPTTGDLGTPGPEAGTLDGRPLAHLMRYCEDYVITCVIEVWRGNENARVDYRRGEISGVTVGGIDAPERLAEVMQWASGNYRLKVPPIQLPLVAPKRATAGAMPVASAPAAVSAAAAAATRQASATKTMFGIPQSEVAAARAAAEAIMAAQGVGTPSPAEVASPPVAAPAPVAAPLPIAGSVQAPVPAPAPAVVVITPPGVAPSAIPAPLGAASQKSATKTIFGVPAPATPEGFSAHEAHAPAPVAKAPLTPPRPSDAATPAESAESDTARTDRIKAGGRKVPVPAPEIVVPAAAAATAAPPPAAASKEVGRTTHHGYESGRSSSAPKKVVDDKTAATRTAGSRPKKQAPIWTYIGVGFTFGLALLGIYQLVGRLAH